MTVNDLPPSVLGVEPDEPPPLVGARGQLPDASGELPRGRRTDGDCAAVRIVLATHGEVGNHEKGPSCTSVGR